MRWAKIKVVRSELATPEAVRKVVKQQRAGGGMYKDAEFEVHYDPRRRIRGRYDLVVMIPMEIPEPVTCAECESHFEPSGDYLCPQCRRYADYYEIPTIDYRKEGS